jgi:glycosyltransferase involved in cell wall biosynthesis
LPAGCYENNPKTVLEAFALGKPVIGARIGGIPELITEDECGYTFEPGNSGELRAKKISLLKAPEKISEMGKNARRVVEERFNPEEHYQKLVAIYTNKQGGRNEDTGYRWCRIHRFSCG